MCTRPCVFFQTINCGAVRAFKLLQQTAGDLNLKVSSFLYTLTLYMAGDKGQTSQQITAALEQIALLTQSSDKSCTNCSDIYRLQPQIACCERFDP